MKNKEWVARTIFISTTTLTTIPTDRLMRVHKQLHAVQGHPEVGL